MHSSARESRHGLTATQLYPLYHCAALNTTMSQPFKHMFLREMAGSTANPDRMKNHHLVVRYVKSNPHHAAGTSLTWSTRVVVSAARRRYCTPRRSRHHR